MNPFRKYNYAVLVGDMKQAGFSEVSAGSVAVDPIDYREGNFKVNSVTKLPGITKYENVTLKWGSTESKEFSDWIANTGKGTITKKTVTIQLYDTANEKVVAEWILTDAWPTKYTMPDFKATENEVAYESIELAHDGIQRKK